MHYNIPHNQGIVETNLPLNTSASWKTMAQTHQKAADSHFEGNFLFKRRKL